MADAVVLRVSSASEILGVIPSLVGFIPSDCVVVIPTRQGRMVVAARVDLVPTRAVDEVVAGLAAAAKRNGADQALVVAYQTGQDGNAIPLVNAIRSAFPVFGIKVGAPIYVTGDQRTGEASFACLCTDPACEGTGPVPAPTGLPGVTVEDSRQVLVDRVAAGDRASSVGVLVALMRRPMTPGDAEAAVTTLMECESVDQLTDSQVALAAYALRHSTYQALAALCLPLTHTEEVSAADFTGAAQRIAEQPSRVERLVGLVACLPDQEARECLEVLAANAYWSGNGALANVALERLAGREGILGVLIDRAVKEGCAPSDY